MRLFLALSLLVACGGSNKPAAEDPAPPATSSLLDCTKVADHVAATVAAKSPPPRVTAAAVKDMVVTRCTTDAWSDATKQCLFAIKLINEGRDCATGMTDVQREAIKAHARQLRADATGPVTDEDQSSDWIKHVVEQ
jgi:hypothetical protein